VRALVPMLADATCAPGWRQAIAIRATEVSGLAHSARTWALRAALWRRRMRSMESSMVFTIAVGGPHAGRQARLIRDGLAERIQISRQRSERLSIYSTMLNDVRGSNVGRAINELTDSVNNCFAKEKSREYYSVSSFKYLSQAIMDRALPHPYFAPFEKWIASLHASGDIRQESSEAVYRDMWGAFVAWCIGQNRQQLLTISPPHRSSNSWLTVLSKIPTSWACRPGMHSD
jgi:hypothetical protein